MKVCSASPRVTSSIAGGGVNPRKPPPPLGPKIRKKILDSPNFNKKLGKITLFLDKIGPNLIIK